MDDVLFLSSWTLLRADDAADATVNVGVTHAIVFGRVVCIRYSSLYRRQTFSCVGGEFLGGKGKGVRGGCTRGVAQAPPRHLHQKMKRNLKRFGEQIEFTSARSD